MCSCSYMRSYCMPIKDYNKFMKKGNTGFSVIRANSHKDSKKDDHFTYFQSLQQKLLDESDKITNLFAKPNTALQTRSLKNSLTTHTQLEDRLARSTKDIENSRTATERESKPQFSEMLQQYLQTKKNHLNSSKSEYFPWPKDKDSQIKRRFTYNMAHTPPDEPKSQINSTPVKSDKVSDVLKNTASTTASSALFKTIDKIKNMTNSKISNSSSPSRSSSKSGRQKGLALNDFMILKFLEEGQFGAVYLVKHKITNFICALKKIPKRIFEGQQKFIGQIIREIKIQSYLDHPNIVQLYCFFSDQENLYLVMQLCCGGNVYASLQREGRFSQDKTRAVVKQISQAVEFMHDSDIIHRDLKPQNILFHQTIAKICDFGWSIYSPLLRDTRCGTPLYSSPQVVQNQQYDNKIDVWNIGIFTYELLYGRVPFQIRTEDELIKVVDEQIYFPKSVPITPSAKDFMLKCLHKNPKERLPMCQLVDHQFLDGRSH